MNDEKEMLDPAKAADDFSEFFSISIEAATNKSIQVADVVPNEQG